MSSEKRAEIVARCRKIVTPDQLKDLSQLIDMLSEDERNQSRHFILIDKLDENWVEDALRFRLIRALIESLRGFRKLRKLKIVVALRSDVLERVMQETNSLGFQKEKYDDYMCNLRWSKAQLRTLISDRLSLLAKRRYSGRALALSDVFPRHVDKKDPFDYILERTLGRPRDILAFFNQCLRLSVGRHDVSATIIKEAEREYSLGRYQALIDEWRGAYPSLPILLTYIGENGGSIGYDDLMASTTRDDLVLKLLCDPKLKNDPIYALAEKVCNVADEIAIAALTKFVIETLYRVGAVGVKLSANDRVLYSHIDMPTLSPGMLKSGARIKIHPMLHRALNISTAPEGQSEAA